MSGPRACPDWRPNVVDGIRLLKAKGYSAGYVVIPVHGHERGMLVDVEVAYLIGEMRWYSHRGYATRSTRVDGARLRVPYHRLASEAGHGDLVDHVNGDTLDNRLTNIRICTGAENSANRPKNPQGSASQYKGVSWAKARRKWSAQIGYRGVLKFLGYFASEDDAARAYDAAARTLHRQFSCVNFPLPGERGAL